MKLKNCLATYCCVLPKEDVENSNVVCKCKVLRIQIGLLGENLLRPDDRVGVEPPVGILQVCKVDIVGDVLARPVLLPDGAAPGSGPGRVRQVALGVGVQVVGVAGPVRNTMVALAWPPT